MKAKWTGVVRQLNCIALSGALAGAVAWSGLARAAEDTPGADTGGTATTTHRSTVSGTIEKIDHKTRSVTIKGENGASVDVAAPRDMTRFDELKVGDHVTASYYESVALAVVPPGAATPATSSSMKRTPSGGATPGGTAVRQMTTTVTIMGLDPNTHEVTFRRANGDVRTVTVDDPTLRDKIAQMKPGDRVQVTYTEALAASITPQQR
jgi:Cu/Ag efflux protein CusF